MDLEEDRRPRYGRRARKKPRLPHRRSEPLAVCRLGERLHLWLPHLERAAERVRQHQGRRAVAAFDRDVEQAAVGIDQGQRPPRSIMNRLAKPDEMRGVIALLISDASSYMTGSVIVVDGGRTIL